MTLKHRPSALPLFVAILAVVSLGLVGCGKQAGVSPAPSGAPAYDFGAWPAGTAPREVGARLVERFLANEIHIHRPSNSIHYVEACTWMGALRYAQHTGDAALLKRLVDRFDPVFAGQPPYVNLPLNVDTAVFGAVPLEIYMRTGDKRFLKPGLDLADAQWTPPEKPLPSGMTYTPAQQAAVDAYSKEAIKQGLSWHTRYWVDDMYMITMLQTQAFHATGDKKYLDRAAAEAVAYINKLQQPNGLFFHADEAPFFWGRGNGWFAAGMSELLRALPPTHKHYPHILEGYRKMMATLLKHQDADGQWRQLIDAPSSWPESSCTGMFTFAFVTGVRHGWLDAAAYGPAARKGWLALVSWLEPDARIREVCEGTNTGSTLQYYLDRRRNIGDLHGQAPVLWAVNALME